MFEQFLSLLKLLVLMVLVGTVSVLPAQNLKVHYALTSDVLNSTTVTDVSGNGLNATLLNGATISTYNGTKVIDLKTANGYVNMGSQLGSVIASLGNFSMMMKVFIPSTSDISGDGNFLWSFANSNNMATDANGCLFFSAKNGRYAISPDNWSSESKIEIGSAISKGAWQTIIYIQKDGLGRIFINGQIAKSGNIPMTPGQLGTTTFNYLGRSCYSADVYLKDAKLADFRIYDAPLSTTQVEQLSGVSSAGFGVSVLAKYEFNTLKDSAGKYTGILQNGAVLDSYSGLGVLSLGNNNGYFDFSAGFGAIVSQLDSFSISTNMLIPASTDLSSDGNFVWTFANSTDMANTANGNIFFSAKKSQYTISKTHWSGESYILINQQLSKGRWMNVTYTQRNGVGKIYINGDVMVQGNITIKPKELGATAFNFIGRSCYSGDKYLQAAMFDNFVVYKGALSDAAIASHLKELVPLNDVLDLAILQQAANTLTIPNANAIRSQITLVSSLGNGITVSWSSANPNVVTNDGLVNRPPAGSSSVQTQLTATLKLNNVSVTKTITVTILPGYNDTQSIQYDLGNLSIIGNTDNIKTSIGLPTTTDEGSQVVWTSDSPEYLSNEGVVVQLSPKGSGKKKVILTATIYNGTQSATKTFEVWVAEDEGFSSYLFAYFTGNDVNGEQIRFAVSNDGYNYTPLNNGQRIMSSDTISIKKGVRDPHILRSADGKTFYMVATDMKSSEGWSSNRGIVMLKSTDLVNWKHARVNFPTKWPAKWANVTRVWAPQTIFDPVAGKYMVYFSLLTNDGTCPYDKIYYCYANDNFTDLLGEPKFLFDRGSATIDGDIVFNDTDNLYYLFFKNEGVGGICQVTSKTLTEAVGQAAGSQWSAPSANLQQTTEAVEGAGVFKLINEQKWVLMYDCYTNGHYQFCSTTNLRNFSFVQDNYTIGARHGTTIPITDDEAVRLAAKWPSTALSGKPLGARNRSIVANGCVIDHNTKTIKIKTMYGINTASFNPLLYALPGTVILPKGNQDFSNGARNYTFSINNTTLTYSVSVTTEANPRIATCSVQLVAGWNLVSFTVDPENAGVQTVFPHALKVKTIDTYFDASVPAVFQTLSQIKGGTAYMVYNSVNETITVTGLQSQPFVVKFNPGWNMFASPGKQSESLENTLGDELQNITTIKNFDGSWLKTSNTNSIQSIEPGKGYFILK